MPPLRLTTFDSRLTAAATVLLSACALILAFTGLFEWDVPLARFLRSFNDFDGSYLVNPWVARFSDLGDRFGGGATLVVVSLVLLAIGYGMNRPAWKDAGWQTLIAHGLAALSATILKHAIGRPRPRFMHTGNFEFSPVTGSGWDSFPSGHAAAAFAVATVLATKVPRARWPILAVTLAIAVSRIASGSHYLTDVAAGTALGCVMGMIAAHPLRKWRASAGMAICRMTPFFVATLAIVWTIAHLPSETWPFQQLLLAGLLLTLSGLVSHVLWSVQSSWRPAWLSGPLARGLVGLGLGMTTGSLFVTIVVLFACTAHWLGGHPGEIEPVGDGPVGPRSAMAEGLFVAAMLLVLGASYALRGIVPM